MAFTLTFTSLALVFVEGADGLVIVFANVSFLTSASTGFLRGLPTDFFAVVVCGAALAGLALAVFALAAERADGLGAEVVFGFGTECNFACVRVSAILVFAAFADLFTVILGRLESVSLIRFPFHKDIETFGHSALCR